MRVYFVAIAFVLIASTAQASPSCMTLREARAIYPGVHLHWKGNHCWFNRSARGAPRARPAVAPRVIAPVVIPIPTPRPEIQDSGAPAPDLPAPQVQIVRRWPAEVMSEALTDRWPDIRPPRVAEPPAPVEQRSTAAVYLTIFVIVLLALFAHLFGDEALHRLSQRRSLFAKWVES